VSAVVLVLGIVVVELAIELVGRRVGVFGSDGE
jgi:hypothetical protein